MKAITIGTFTLLLALSTQADGPSRGYSTTQTFGTASQQDPEAASFYQVTPPPRSDTLEGRRNRATQVKDQKAFSAATTKTITPARNPSVNPEKTSFAKPNADKRKINEQTEREETDTILKSAAADSPFERTFFESAERDPRKQFRVKDRTVLKTSATTKARKGRTFADWP